MQIIKNTLAALVSTLLLAATAQAQIGVTADIGTTGVGAHIVVPMEKTLNGRFGVNYFSRSDDKVVGNLTYDTKSKSQSIDILFDWYLIDNSPVHVTAGLVYNGNRMTAVGRADSANNFTLNGKLYTAAQVGGGVTGRLDYRKAAPYLGIGWGNALSPAKAWNFTAETGVFFQGRPDAAVSATACTSSAAFCTQLARDIAGESANFKAGLHSYKAFPVLRAAATYRF